MSDKQFISSWQIKQLSVIDFSHSSCYQETETMVLQNKEDVVLWQDSCFTGPIARGKSVFIKNKTYHCVPWFFCG